MIEDVAAPGELGEERGSPGAGGGSVEGCIFGHFDCGDLVWALGVMVAVAVAVMGAPAYRGEDAPFGVGFARADSTDNDPVFVVAVAAAAPIVVVVVVVATVVALTLA